MTSNLTFALSEPVPDTHQQFRLSDQAIAPPPTSATRWRALSRSGSRVGAADARWGSSRFTSKRPSTTTDEMMESSKVSTVRSNRNSSIFASLTLGDLMKQSTGASSTTLSCVSDLTMDSGLLSFQSRSRGSFSRDDCIIMAAAAIQCPLRQSLKMSFDSHQCRDLSPPQRPDRKCSLTSTTSSHRRLLTVNARPDQCPKFPCRASSQNSLTDTTVEN
ncbi:expressed unknown protein [Seminavis robusta]|uniref:Uncharacterized protein n=1 Tax=Seminavis robusta TaxID=568900 RepID=A0A9N8D9A4_9STRA|nr:expressed unknown protein [Seminavis robusta]|eukprot:Sro39_g024190.1 n/a (218) ;mRNA; f:90704-91357